MAEATSITVSAAVFGNSHMANIVADLSRRTQWPVTTRQVAASTGLADSLVRAVLFRLVAAEALNALPKMDGSRGKQFFDKANPNWWVNLTALACSIAPASTEIAHQLQASGDHSLHITDGTISHYPATSNQREDSRTQ